MVYLDNIDIRIMSELLPGSANKCVLRTRLVVFCFLFQRGNTSTVNYIGGKQEALLQLRVSGARLGCVFWGRVALR